MTHIVAPVPQFSRQRLATCGASPVQPGPAPRIRRLLFACKRIGVALFALLLVGCPPRVRSLATLRLQDLPGDPMALQSQADELFTKGDSVSWENALVVLEKQRRLEPRSVEPMWRMAKAAFLLADAADNDRNRRAWFADLGMRQSKTAIAIAPDRVEGHYYFALCVGYVAQTRSFLRRVVSARELVRQIERAGKKALAIDPRFDHAGPNRLLGVVYLRAPGWPASIGDPDEALTLLTKAVELDGDYPENRLYLAEALFANGELAEADAQADRVLAVQAAAVAAEPWAARLARWQNEARTLKIKIQERR